MLDVCFVVNFDEFLGWIFNLLVVNLIFIVLGIECQILYVSAFSTVQFDSPGKYD